MSEKSAQKTIHRRNKLTTRPETLPGGGQLRRFVQVPCKQVPFTINCFKDKRTGMDEPMKLLEFQ